MNHCLNFFDEYIEQYHKMIKKVGEGTTSNTYKIMDIRTKEIMCKKIIKVEEGKTTFRDMQNAIKEFEVLCHLHHPCISRAIVVNTHEVVGQDEETCNEIPTIAFFFEFIDFKLSNCIAQQILNIRKGYNCY